MIGTILPSHVHDIGIGRRAKLFDERFLDSEEFCSLLGRGVEVAVEMDKTVGDVAEEFAGRGQGMSVGETTGGLGAHDDFTVGKGDDVRG